MFKGITCRRPGVTFDEHAMIADNVEPAILHLSEMKPVISEGLLLKESKRIYWQYMANKYNEYIAVANIVHRERPDVLERINKLRFF